MKILLRVLFAALCLCGPLYAQDRPLAFVGAKIIPIVGAPIEDGVLIVQGGKIVAVGSRASIKIPADAIVTDVTGKIMMPGLVDSHSHIGEPAGGDGSSPIQPDTRVLDSINVHAPSFQRAQSGGITTANVMPGSGHLDSGQTLYLKLRDSAVKIDDLLIYDKAGKIMGGIKFANGTNSIRTTGSGPFPGTRAKSVALVREQFIKAQEYRAKIQKAAGDATKMPPRDLGLEALVEVLDGKRTIHFHTHRNDDIMSVLRLQKEFGFKVVLHHVSEAWKVADEIAKAKVACSIILIDSPGGKLETMDIKYENAAALEKAGVLVGFHTDDPITDSRLLLREAAIGVRGGMSRDKALYALTMANAIILDLQDRVGSLEPGKDADFIVLSGDPLSVYTHVLLTYVEGKKVFDRSNPDDYKIAVGGYGVGSDQDMHDDGEDDEDGGNE
jgi:imidazolonepropionase-like amidohydrolase